MGILRFNYRSEILSLNTDITVVYPTGALTAWENGEPSLRGFPTEQGKRPYREGMKFQTVYLLHGGGDDDTLPYRYTMVETYAEQHNLMLVTPQVKDSFYLDTPYGFKYHTYITQELPRVIRSLFASSDKREDNFLIGFAMGGNAALQLAFTNPEMFNTVIAMSGGIGVTLDRNEMNRQLGIGLQRLNAMFGEKDEFLGTDNDLYALAEKRLTDGTDMPRIIMAQGSDEFIHDRVYNDQRILKELGYDITYYELPGGKHDFFTWDALFKKSFDEWLPLKEKPIYPNED